MVFLRLSACNLRCPFCDTDFSASREMTAAEIVNALLSVTPSSGRVCITGGEPALQLDSPLIDALHEADFRIHLETNGTRALPAGIDWITLSPKEDFAPHAQVVLPKADELKLVYTGLNDPEKWLGFPAAHYFLQPCDPGEICPADGGHHLLPEAVDTTAATLRYILSHPRWRLSLQTHKILGIA